MMAMIMKWWIECNDLIISSTTALCRFFDQFTVELVVESTDQGTMSINYAFIH